MICFAFLVVDLVVLGVILLFSDVSRWKLRKMVKNLGKAQKGNSYICGFIVMAILRSLGNYLVLTKELFWDAEGWSVFYSFIKQWAGYFLAVAMAGVGLGTDIKKLRKLGTRPFVVGLFAALSVGIVSVILIKILAPFLAAMK